MPVSLFDALPQRSLMNLKAIAQIHNTYILCEHPARIWLIEQHVAHERLVYDRLGKDWEFVEITPPQRLAGLSDGQAKTFERWGFNIQSFDPGVWIVRTLSQAMLDDSDRQETSVAESNR
ncbi:MAG: hypothetical protein AAGB01_02345 [Cyanobacteria bacterium P01_F01_bin.42]